MLKNYLRIILTSIVLLALTACGGGGGDTPVADGTTKTAVEKVETTDKNETVVPTDKNETVVPTDKNETVVPKDKNETVLPEDKNETILPKDKNETVLPKDKNESIDKTSPLFTSNSLVNVDENQKSVISISTDDALAVLSLEGKDASLFDLTGSILTFKSAPNYEATPSKTSFEVEIKAKDTQGNASRQTLVINLQNIPETAPILDSNLSLNIEENTTLTTVLGQISISDGGDSDIISFDIIGTDNDIIEIDSQGQITLAKQLDYERKTNYSFTVSARNDFDKSNTINLEINVTNSDDLNIQMAIYDTSILYVYFSKEINEATRDTSSEVNYQVSGAGDITGAIGEYLAPFRQDKITLSNSSITAFVPFETNLSIISSGIAEANGLFADSTLTRVFEVNAIKNTGQIKSYDLNGSEDINNSIKDNGFYQNGVIGLYIRDESKEIVLDTLTGLMWQDNEVFSKIEADANDYCTDLILGAFEDWRMPTSIELGGIVDFRRVDPAIESVFVHTENALYWASDDFFNDSNISWGVDFSDGSIYEDEKFEVTTPNTSFVRCVRESY